MGRAHHEHFHTPGVEWVLLDWPGWPGGARVKLLSRDAGTGALSALVELPAGWQLPAGCHASERELLVLAGTVRVDGEEHGPQWWEWAPAGAALGGLAAVTRSELLVFMRTGVPDLLPADGADAAPAAAAGIVRIDAAAVPWAGNPVDDGPSAVRVKLLRLNPVTGELHALVEDGVEPYSVYEFHDCVEEVFLIAGDLTLGNSGEMLPGSYFWRPPYLTHGMSTSRGGSFYYVWTDCELVNHRTDAMSRTPEENRAAATAARAAGRSAAGM